MPYGLGELILLECGSTHHIIRSTSDTLGVWVNSSQCHYHEHLISTEFSGAIMYGRDDIEKVTSKFCYLISGVGLNIPQTHYFQQ